MRASQRWSMKPSARTAQEPPDPTPGALRHPCAQITETESAEPPLPC